ncbi:hypothetical protein LJC00_00630 [Dysgonomonas sp. OttesenSCG-928-M03]|nr:hypothetical protein [Dysgonomonas sp. OttesenSCG-928-M03]
MNNQIFNDKIIDAIREKLPSDISLTTILSETLFLGKEALYRRLRGTVPFTFAEIVSLCEKFDLSLDYIFKKEQQTKAVFDLCFLDPYDSDEVYFDMLTNYVRKVRKLRSYPNSYSLMALNILPYMFYQPLESISKFNIFKWRYIMNKGIDKITFSDFSITDKVRNIQKEATRETLSILKNQILLSPRTFESFLNDINYFRQIYLISDDDYLSLKEELNAVLDDLEYMTIHGKYRAGNEVMIYLSNIDFLASYVYFGSDGFEFTHFRICAANCIDSEDPVVCTLKKDWINSLMKASTLISLSGGIERIAFFEKQRKLINDPIDDIQKNDIVISDTLNII